VDSPVSGSFELYVVRDVVAHVAEHFPTIAVPESRGILGYSSGGVGAWNIGSSHPETFGALAMLSGDCLLDVTHKPMLYEYLDSVWPEAPNGPIEGNFLSELVYAYSACYSPNPGNPPFFVDLPIEFPTGELVVEAWERWLRFDPVVNWRSRLENLRKLSGILLDVGVSDDYELQWGHRLLSHHLGGAGITHEATENEGDHGGRSRERVQVGLRWLSRILSRS
jgi:S-formylglutathione hydrolase FrmB